MGAVVVAVLLLVVMATGGALVSRRRLAVARDERGVSEAVVALMLVVIGLTLAWFARDSLFDAGGKQDRRLQQEVDRNE